MPVAISQIPSTIAQPLPDMRANTPSRVQPAAPMMNSARMSRRRRALAVVPYRSSAARRRTFSNMACGAAKESVG
jgi:hypothetical protein